MKIAPAAILLVFLACALQGCAFLATPLVSGAVGGAQLALKGAELREQISRADARKAIDASFERVWLAAATVPVNLDIVVTRSQVNQEENGSLVEGVAGKTRIRIVVVQLTEKVTEIGVWADHDKAFAELIAERISEDALEEPAATSLLY